jgi:transposase
MRQRGELIERSFAHNYETGAMRRTHLRGHNNIGKRQLIHVGGFNLGLVMRKLIGIGKPRRLQGLAALIFGLILSVWKFVTAIRSTWTTDRSQKAILPPVRLAA